MGPTYIHILIPFCILVVTGIPIDELLPLKVNQLKSLTEKNYSKLKEGFSTHFLMKEPNAYVFSLETTHFKNLRR